MKPAEIYKAQLEEDEKLEAYWQKKLDRVPRDQIKCFYEGKFPMYHVFK